MFPNGGLAPKTMIKDTGPIKRFATMTNLYFVSSFSFSISVARKLLAVFFSFLVSLIKILFAKTLPNDGSFYFTLAIRPKE